MFLMEENCGVAFRPSKFDTKYQHVLVWKDWNLNIVKHEGHEGISIANIWYIIFSVEPFNLKIFTFG